MNISEALRLHQLWLADDPSGVRFVAAGTDLSGADLTDAVPSDTPADFDDGRFQPRGSE